MISAATCRMKSPSVALVGLVIVGLCAPSVLGLYCYECDKGGCVQPWFNLRPQNCDDLTTRHRTVCFTMQESGVITSMGCDDEEGASTKYRTTCREPGRSCTKCYTDLCNPVNAASRSTSSAVGPLAVGLAASLVARLLVRMA